MTDEEITEIKTQYRDMKPRQNGTDSIQIIADLHGCGRLEIEEILGHIKPRSEQKPQAEFKPRKVTRPRVDKAEMEKRIEKIKEMALSGMSDNEIARELHCVASVVNYNRKKLKIPATHSCKDGGKRTRETMRKREKPAETKEGKTMDLKKEIEKECQEKKAAEAAADAHDKEMFFAVAPTEEKKSLTCEAIKEVATKALGDPPRFNKQKFMDDFCDKLLHPTNLPDPAQSIDDREEFFRDDPTLECVQKEADSYKVEMETIPKSRYLELIQKERDFECLRIESKYMLVKHDRQYEELEDNRTLLHLACAELRRRG